MQLFQCTLCEEKFPTEFKNNHHRIPKFAGGSDEDSNMEYLCAGCHQILHAIARMLNNPKKMGMVDDYITLYYSESNQKVHCKELAFLIVKYKTYKDEGKLDLSEKKMQIPIELPLLYHTVLRTTANECRDGDTKRKMGMSKYIKLLIMSHLQQKYPKLKNAKTLTEVLGFDTHTMINNLKIKKL